MNTYYVKYNPLTCTNDVIESATGHVMHSAVYAGGAKSYSARCNSGIGFAGWTPAFMFESFRVSMEEGENDVD